MDSPWFGILEESSRFERQCRVIIFAPHPDDEVIGAFSFLIQFQAACFVVFVTDGAPLKLGKDRLSVRRRRRDESDRVAASVGIPSDQIIRIGIPDQDAVFQFPRLITFVSELLRRLRPSLVIVPAYEGGHPDHDSTAFSIHRAACLLGRDAPPLIEMCLYHSHKGQFAIGQFLEHSGASDGVRVELSATEQYLKRAAFAIYRSQAEVLKWFRTDIERFRLAPKYDFQSPPHLGPLFYEQFDWGISGVQWRELAARSMKSHCVMP
jgi:LmbE family N-acetylglucosaminyl deacetylase